MSDQETLNSLSHMWMAGLGSYPQKAVFTAQVRVQCVCHKVEFSVIRQRLMKKDIFTDSTLV